MDRSAHRILLGPATVTGRMLAAATSVVASLRRAPQPLHPDGVVDAGILVRHGAPHTGARRTGAEWLDEPGIHEVLVRRSRAAGLPEPWPDVHGLALRVLRGQGRASDILLATTGSRGIGRFVLQPGLRPDLMFFGSLLPYHAPAGPVVLGARRRTTTTWDLLYAVGLGSWTTYATLVLEESQADRPLSMDAVLNPLPGLPQYDAIARLRLPAYRTARRRRQESSAGASRGPGRGISTGSSPAPGQRTA